MVKNEWSYTSNSPTYLHSMQRNYFHCIFFLFFSYFYLYFCFTGKDKVGSYMVLDIKTQYFSTCTFFLPLHEAEISVF
jgi:hypothetical protein